MRTAAKTMLVLSLVLPVVQGVLFWVRGLLANMGDDSGAQILAHVGLACQVIWTISLVGLLIVVAVIVLNEPTPKEHD